LGQEKCFVNYHRVLNRARWSLLAASHILLRLWVTRFAPEGELVFGLDDTIERRRGETIAAKGIYRDPARSSQAHFVKASDLRWLCCMLLVHVSWAGSIWDLNSLQYYIHKNSTMLNGDACIKSCLNGPGKSFG